MHRIERDVEEEALLRVPGDELDRGVPEPIGHMAAFRLPLAVALEGAVGDRVLERTVGARPHEEAEELVEAAAIGVELRRIAEVPLADEPGGTSGVAQPVGDGALVERQPALLIALGDVALVTEALLIATGEKPGACRGAHTSRRVGVGEAHPFAGDPVDLRRQRCDVGGRLRLEPEVRAARIVAEDHDDVAGSGWCGGLLRRRRGDEDEGEQGEDELHRGGC